jgi:molecular chaperone IbpA
MINGMFPTKNLVDSIKDFDRFFIGFDDQWNKLSKVHDDITKGIPNYPPYNIKKIDENKYSIEVAVAGFGKQDIEIELADSQLIIKGNTGDDQNDYLHKGIASRAFTRKFVLNDYLEVKNAELLNGMLKIFLERMIPDHKKPKKIDIKDTVENDKQLLKG